MGAVAYLRLNPVRQFFTFASIGVLVIPATFLLNSDISKIVFPRASPRAASVEVTSTTPVVMVIFDELPVISLMDENGPDKSGALPQFCQFSRRRLLVSQCHYGCGHHVRCRSRHFDRSIS